MIKRRIRLKQVKDLSYDIFIDTHVFAKAASWIKKNMKASKYAVITDSNVAELYAKKFSAELKRNGLRNDVLVFNAGEKSKTLATVEGVVDVMAKHGYGRDSAVVALGGGVVGDLAGFTAATYARGIPFVQVPTTLLAMADSSVGGKTGVDTGLAKNMVGSFWQPKAVFMSMNALKSLPDRELRNGLAESIKHALIMDRKFFGYLEKNMGKILKRDVKALAKAAEWNVKIKGSVVEKDPEEKAFRRVLNYGHTIGHAVEHASNYRVAHGEAVAIGCVVAGKIGVIKKWLKESEVERYEELFKKAGLKTKIPKKINNSRILKAITIDKKAKKGRARFAMLSGIGKVKSFNGAYADYIDNKVVVKALGQCR